MFYNKKPQYTLSTFTFSVSVNSRNLKFLLVIIKGKIYPRLNFGETLDVLRSSIYICLSFLNMGSFEN